MLNPLRYLGFVLKEFQLNPFIYLAFCGLGQFTLRTWPCRMWWSVNHTTYGRCIRISLTWVPPFWPPIWGICGFPQHLIHQIPSLYGKIRAWWPLNLSYIMLLSFYFLPCNRVMASLIQNFWDISNLATFLMKTINWLMGEWPQYLRGCVMLLPEIGHHFIYLPTAQWTWTLGQVYLYVTMGGGDRTELFS